MGANATTSVPSYVAGEVLTAADLNVTNSGIPVFSDSTARTNAFGGTGEKVLAEGQYAYLESDNKTYVYDGSAWQQVGASGFVVVKAETSFSASSSITADSVFTSSYTNYRLMINYQTSTTGSIYLRLRASGSSATGSNYSWQRILANGGTITGAQNASISYFEIGNPSNGAYNSTVIIDFFSPQLAEPTLVNYVNHYNNGAYTTPLWYAAGGNHSLSTAYDGIEIYPASGTTTGTYTIYGYGKTL
jgi:hypothetical protein